jgi:Fe-S-cluster containining protein
MRLPVVQETVWYEGGLRFACTSCGNCCEADPSSYVAFSGREVVRLAGGLRAPVRQVMAEHFARVTEPFVPPSAGWMARFEDAIRRTWWVGVGWFQRWRGVKWFRWEGKYLLKMKALSPGRFVCPFLKQAGGGKRLCSIYEWRPGHCRTWPFWEENLETAEGWEELSKGCPGMNKGRGYGRAEFEAIRVSE